MKRDSSLYPHRHIKLLSYFDGFGTFNFWLAFVLFKAANFIEYK